MCLDVDHDDWVEFDRGVRVARQPHRCEECRRDIDPGERYHYWTGASDGRASTTKMCSHCRATIALGAAVSGCPEAWYDGAVFDVEDGGPGFVADILNHDLPRAHRLRMLRTFAASRRWWRWSNGTLMPVPALER